jgi:signal transduction histidine kinase
MVWDMQSGRQSGGSGHKCGSEGSLVMLENQNLSPALSEELSEVLPIAMVKLDAKGKVLFMNRASHELLTAMKINAENLSQVLPQRHRFLVRQALRDKHYEETDWVQDGRSLHLIFKASADGASAYLFMIDLTAQEDAKAQLIQSEKMASLGLLVAGLAHEINTPLGAIHSNNDTITRSLDKISQLLIGEQLLSSEDKRRVEQLVQILRDVCQTTSLATDRLISIVGSLKNFARIDEADFKKADIHEGIDSTLTIVQHQLKGRIEVEKHFGDLPPVECHPNRLNQVFVNLLINAAQAIPDRGTITISTACKGDAVTISISDTGTGIDPEDLSKIFDPGFTTKGVGVGTGLGLSICYKIIEEHNGKIDVESDNQGTTFRITLPVSHGGRPKKVKRG